jgi:two-component system, cell cycle sensor histidine kinase and response regulator CckA
VTPEQHRHYLHLVNQQISGLTGNNAKPSEEEELRQQNEELNAAHLELDNERRRYQELFELAPDAYLATSLTGIIEEANQSAAGLFGIAPQFLTGKALAAYIASEDRPRFRALLSEPVQIGRRQTTLFRLRTRAGKRLVAELIYSVAEGPDGKPVGIRWLIRDVTEQERLARQIRTLNAELETRVAERTADLRAAQQLSDDLFHREQAARRAAEASEAQSRHVQKLESIGVLAGGIAHDFNNLLHVVLGNADIALSRLPARSHAREPLEEVVRATLRAADLTRQMLAYSGKGAFVVRHLDLSSEVREMASLLRTAISKQATLVSELASNLPAVNADPTQIRQVLMNLITNASDALREASGTITLRTGVVRRDELNDPKFGSPPMQEESSPGGDELLVYLEVSDTGAGMTPDTLQRIFDPFFSTKFAGRGLGLAAVMGIVQSHQGLIRIRTEPGQGTSFRVLFPAAAGPARKLEQPSPARSDWQGEGTVLVVDDEEGVREVAERMLQEIGFNTISAIDGREALEVMHRIGDRVTAVLLDLSMPRMGGQETLRHLRAHRPHLPIIMMSGYTEQAVAPPVNGSGPGMTVFLQKPFLAEDLIGVLRPIVEVAT